MVLSCCSCSFNSRFCFCRRISWKTSGVKIWSYVISSIIFCIRSIIKCRGCIIYRCQILVNIEFFSIFSQISCFYVGFIFNYWLVLLISFCFNSFCGSSSFFIYNWGCCLKSTKIKSWFIVKPYFWIICGIDYSSIFNQWFTCLEFLCLIWSSKSICIEIIKVEILTSCFCSFLFCSGKSCSIKSYISINIAFNICICINQWWRIWDCPRYTFLRFNWLM